MSPFSKTTKNFKLVAGVLGLIEGLAWIVLSIICIVLHLTSTLELNVGTYMDGVDFLFYRIFIKSDSDLDSFFSGQILTPSHFHIYVWFCLIVNVVWCGVSINVFRNSTLRASVKIWSFTTWMVCLLDFILVALLGADYDACLDGSIVTEAVCANGILPVLTIAARGFVLWIVNFILAFILNKLSDRINEEPHLEEMERQSQTQFGNHDYSPRVVRPQVHANSNRPSYNNDYGYSQPTPSPRQKSPPKRQWHVYSPAPGSPKTSQNSPFGSYWRSPTPGPNSYGNQQPFVLGPPPKRRH